MNAARVISLALALVATALLIADRRALDDGLPWTVRAGLALVTAGIIGATTHGLAIAAESRLLRFVAEPRTAWPAIILGLGLVFVEGLVS